MEDRARPARERQRFESVIAANKWFWAKMEAAEDPQWSVMEEWLAHPVSVMIRRWRAANPEEMPGESQEATPRAL